MKAALPFAMKFLVLGFSSFFSSVQGNIWINLKNFGNVFLSWIVEKDEFTHVFLFFLFLLWINLFAFYYNRWYQSLFLIYFGSPSSSIFFFFFFLGFHCNEKLLGWMYRFVWLKNVDFNFIFVSLHSTCNSFNPHIACWLQDQRLNNDFINVFKRRLAIFLNYPKGNDLFGPLFYDALRILRNLCCWSSFQTNIYE